MSRQAKAIEPLFKKTGATILLGTPPLLHSWSRVTDPDDMMTLRHVILGAEPMQKAIVDAFAIDELELDPEPRSESLARSAGPK